MEELSLNILDIAQNSVRAGAGRVDICVTERPADDRLIITITDDGCGMTPEQVAHVEDPFYTTRTTRKVGLGVPFFKMAAPMTGGDFSIRSHRPDALGEYGGYHVHFNGLQRADQLFLYLSGGGGGLFGQYRPAAGNPGRGAAEQPAGDGIYPGIH